MNYNSHFNSSGGTPFRSGLPLNSSLPTNISYSSLPETGNRLANSPPLPPPRTQQPLYSYSSPYTSSYGRYGPYFNRPMFNSYSPYQQSYTSPYAAPVPHDASFIQDAQESSREAFAGIEGIVNTFGSINMMIESTYYALQSSFNAVLSVAENFSQLRSQFGQVLSAFAILRTFQWLYRKLLYLIGLRALDPATDSAWRMASRSVEESEFGAAPRRSSWPMLMFLIVVYAGPFLMWKFVSSIMQRGKSKDSWLRENGDYYYAIAKYSYKARSPDELSFSAGDYLKLAPYEKQTDKSWPLASDGKSTGIIPVNYIDIRFKSAKSSSSQPNASNHGNVSALTQNLSSTSNAWAGEALQAQSKAPPISRMPLVHESSPKTTDLNKSPCPSELVGDCANEKKEML